MAPAKKERKANGYGTADGSIDASSARPAFVELGACSDACPCGTDVRGFLTALGNGSQRGLTQAEAIQEAFYIIAERNPIPAVLGRLCPRHCETVCGESLDGGVSVNQVERAIAEAAINAAWPLRKGATTAVPAVVTVIGAGTAGLSAAYQLARRGHKVTLADSHPEAGGELRYGVEAERLPRPVLEAEVDRILALGVKFNGSVDVATIGTTGEGRVITTKVYEDGTPVAFAGLAAAVNAGRLAAEQLDAGSRDVTVVPAPTPVNHSAKSPAAETDAGARTPEAAIRESQRCLTCGARLARRDE